MTTHNVLHNLVVGMILVVAILFVFLGDIASAGIVAIMIPLALLFSVTVLYIQGKSANLLSIGAVDFGIIVDSSVIIVENIFRHITAHGSDRSRPLIDRIAEASHEIERALFFSTAIIVCAFIPLFAMTGPEGALFGPMANTYAFAIFGALLLAVSLAPVLCSFLYSNSMEEKDTFIDKLMKQGYLRALNRYLNLRWLTLDVMIGLLVFTFTLIPGLGGEFMPQLEEGNLWIRALLPRTVSLEAAERMAPRLREVIASIPEIKNVMSHVGRPDDGTDVTSFFNLEFNAPLKPMEQWRKGMTREKIEDELIGEVQGVPRRQLQLLAADPRQRRGGPLGRQGGELGQAVRQRPPGPGGDRPAGRQHPQRRSGGSRTSACSTSWASRTWRSRSTARPARRYGVNVADVEAAVQVAIGGKAFSQMVEGEKLYDIILRLPVSLRDDPTVINRIPVDTPGADGKTGRPDPARPARQDQPPRPGGLVYLSREQPALHPDQVQRPGPRPRLGDRRGPEEGQRPEDRRRSGQGRLQGYRIEWSGEFAQMQAANARLMWIVPLSIGLIMGLLYTAFNSFKDALLVMVNVVAATMGGIWALRITHTPFSISAAVGFISIFGVAVQDGVLLISYFNQLRAAGLPVRESVLRGAELRVRPMVMTSLTAALGLMPGRVRDLDRLAGPEAAGDRGGRRDARDPGPDPLPHARPLLVLPGPGGPRRAARGTDRRLALHRRDPPRGPTRGVRPRSGRPFRLRLRRRPSWSSGSGGVFAAIVFLRPGKSSSNSRSRLRTLDVVELTPGDSRMRSRIGIALLRAAPAVGLRSPRDRGRIDDHRERDHER